MRRVRVTNRTKGVVIAGSVQAASGFLERLRGLLARPMPGPDQGMYIEPCSAIHTFFMSYAIDCAFLAPTGDVLHVAHRLGPWRAAGPVAGARGVLELAPGRLAETGTDVGDVLVLEDA